MSITGPFPLPSRVFDLDTLNTSLATAAAEADRSEAAAVEAEAAAATAATDAAAGADALIATRMAEIDTSVTAASNSATDAQTAASLASTYADAAEDAVQYDYLVDDNTALAAIVGMTLDQRAFVRDTEHVWRYDGAAWVDMGVGPTSGKASVAIAGAIPQNARTAEFLTRTGFVAGEVRLTAQAAGNLNDFTGVTAAVVGGALDLTCVTPNSGAIMWKTGNYRGAVSTRIRLTETVDVGDTETGEFGPTVVVGSVADATMRIFHYASDGDLHVLGFDSVILASKANAGMSFAKGEAATLELHIEADGSGYMLATAPNGSQAKFRFTGAPVGTIWPGLRRGHSATLTGWRVDTGADVTPTLAEDRALGGVQKPIALPDLDGPFAATTDAASTTQPIAISGGVASASITSGTSIFYLSTPQVITDQGAWEVVASASYGDMNGCGPMIGVGVGTARRWYSYLGNGFLGVLLNANTVESGGATAPAYAVNTVATVRLLRRRDGTGTLEATAPDGSTARLELTGIPTGAVTMGFRRPGTGTGVGVTALSRFVCQPVPETTTALDAQVASLDTRVTSLEAGAGILTSAVLDAWGILPDSTAGRAPPGFTPTGLGRITRGAYKGCWLVADDGRLVEGDASPFVPRVHLISPDFQRILATLDPGYTGASAQGVCIDTSGAADTYWLAGSANRTARHFSLAGVEVTGDLIDGTNLDGGAIAGNFNGIARIAAENALLISMSTGTTLYKISCDPAASPRILETYAGDWGGTNNGNTPDQLWYDDASGLLYYSMGDNSASCGIYSFNLATETSAAVWTGLENIEAIEGFVIDWDKRLLWVVNDGGYHNAAEPALNIWARFRIPAA